LANGLASLPRYSTVYVVVTVERLDWLSGGLPATMEVVRMEVESLISIRSRSPDLGRRRSLKVTGSSAAATPAGAERTSARAHTLTPIRITGSLRGFGARGHSGRRAGRDWVRMACTILTRSDSAATVRDPHRFDSSRQS